MGKDRKLKLFISYSHKDEHYVDEFRTHIALLKQNNLIEDWYDRKILPGKEFKDEIDVHFDNMNIICLFFSANFIDSNACMKELDDALILRKKKGTVILPIILSKCSWLDIDRINGTLALPVDGSPVSKFNDPDEAWNIVYEELKKVVESELKTFKLTLTETFQSLLEDMEMLTKAHSEKEKVILDDIFIFPELETYDNLDVDRGRINSKNILDRMFDQSKILIAGENQSGKTTLCKKIFSELRALNFIPIYIADGDNRYRGKIDNKLEQAFNEQYNGVSLEEVDRKKIVPILDDFHQANNKERHIKNLVQYEKQIVIVDDIFCLNFKDEGLVEAYSRYRIREFSPSLRNKLIEKWVSLTDKINSNNQNDTYREIDKKTELVNTALGKIIGSGIMPSYPFFILSVITTFDAVGKPLDQKITSHGHCYQALIYVHLRRSGVKNEEIDSYVNFITELAFYFFKEQRKTISSDILEEFISNYKVTFNLSIKKEVLLNRLGLAMIVAQDNFNNYSFPYPYVYYYFVGKYLAENMSENEKLIDKIIHNLHKNENAHIAIFISHHTKSTYILDEIRINAMCLFDKYLPATLSKEELSFFDYCLTEVDTIDFPKTEGSPEKERQKRLKKQDELESRSSKVHEKECISSNDEDDFGVEIRRSIKTVEVMGQILKNREGSLKIPEIEEIFREAINVHLRFLMSFLELIREPDSQKEIIHYLSNNLEKSAKKKAKDKCLQSSELTKSAKNFFWITNFSVVYLVIWKIIRSTGSDKLIRVIDKVCDELNTPASFLIKHGIRMWYQKNIQLEDIEKAFTKGAFSDTTNNILMLLVYDFSAIHYLKYNERQRIEHIFEVPPKKLLTMKAKAKEKNG